MDKGYFVRVLDPLFFGRDPIRSLEENPNFDLQISLTEDKYMLEKCLKGIYGVIHLSGLSNDPSCEIDASLTRKANVDATKVLLKLSKETGVERLIFASTCSVYGYTDDNVVDERSPLNPLTAYAKSINDSEELIIPEASNGFMTVSLRQATLYGPSARMRFDLVLNTMTGMAISDRKIIINGGEQWRPFLHVDDTADACTFMLEGEKEKINGQIFNVGSNEANLRIKDLAKCVAKIIPDVKIEQSDSADHRSYHVSFDKIASIGWAPKLNVEDGIRGVKKIFDDDSHIDFRDLRFFNIKRMLSYLNI